MSDEEFEVADAGNMEPELKPDSPQAQGDDAGFDPEAEVERALGGQEATEVRGKRPPARMSKAERDLMTRALAAMNPGRKPGESYRDTEDAGESFVDDGETETPEIGDAPVKPTPTPEPQADDASRRLAEVEARAAELDKREQATAAREAAADIEGWASKYLEGPVATLRKWFQDRGLALTDEEWQSEVADLITDLSGQVLKVPVPSEIKERIEGRRVVRASKYSRQQDARMRERLEQERAAAQRDVDRQRASVALTQELQKPEHRAAYEWLMAEQDPAGIIIAIVDDEHGRTKKQLTWQQAAQRANDYLQDKAIADYNRRKPLLEKASKPKQGTPQRPQLGARPQGTSQVTKPPQPAPEAPQPTERPVARPAVNPKNWNEAHRQATKRAFRKSFMPDS